MRIPHSEYGMSDFLDSEMKEEGSPDVDNKIGSSEMDLLSMMSADLPAMISDEIEYLLISDEHINWLISVR